jgi:hypothetical protein
MIEVQNTKTVIVTPPAAIVDNAAIATTAIDTLGWRHCLILVIFGATDIAMTALKLQHSDASGSGFADIPNADFSATALPSATSDNTAWAFDVALTGKKKRYLDVVATGGDGTAGTYCTIIAVLSRGENVPNSASERGLTGLLSV